MTISVKQVVLDLYNCDYDLLNNENNLKELLIKTMSENYFSILSHHSQKYQTGSDFSVIIFYQQGHVIVHAFPETGFASVDIFSGLPTNGLDKLASKIKQGLKSEKSKITYLRRGDFGSISDMKPTIHRQTKAWRRVRNTSEKMLRIIANQRDKNKSSEID